MSKQCIKDLRMVADYLLAVRNEIAVDENFLRLSGLPICMHVRLPRPAIWLSMVRKMRWFLPSTTAVARFIWWVFAFLYFARQRNATCSENTLPPTNEHELILAFSSRCSDIVHSEHIQPLPSRWLSLPWIPLGVLPQGAEATSIFSFLSEEDLDHALRLACFAHKMVHSRSQLRPWGLQTYTAWRWFAVRLAVDKLHGPLFMVEHFDRWAILADSSAANSRRHGKTRKLTLMQHGSVGAKTDNSSLKVTMPSRLRAITRLHVYSENDAIIFMRDFLSANCNRIDLDLSFYQPRITLKKFSNTSIPRILFVGHPICEVLHCQVLKILLANNNILAYYKPHPTVKYIGSVVLNQVWTVIKGRDVFPEVDLLVSYPSTIISEYGIHGICSIEHPIELVAGKAEILAKEISIKLNELCKLKSTPSSYLCCMSNLTNSE